MIKSPATPAGWAPFGCWFPEPVTGPAAAAGADCTADAFLFLPASDRDAPAVPFAVSAVAAAAAVSAAAASVVLVHAAGAARLAAGGRVPPRRRFGMVRLC